jgi:sugar fermentation stimulation protein A
VFSRHEDEGMRMFGKVFRTLFLNRPNRFLIRCKRRGKVLSAFLPNPGRLQELFLPGSVIYLTQEGNSGNRRTCYTAVAVERNGHPIMLHTHLNNEVARYLLEKRKIPGLEGAQVVRSEVKMGRSRFDFLLREGTRDIFLEVKSCTLVGKRVAMFPDAVTERGTRHLRELARLSEGGAKAVVLFIVHWPFARLFMPDFHTDLNFARTLLQVRGSVQVIPVSVKWNGDLALSPRIKVLEIPWNYIEKEAFDRGSYLLILKLKEDRKVDIGKWGEVLFKKGFYVYVGSAMANLSKRMDRHRRLRKRHHWHIDDLRAVAEFHSILAIRASERLECEISETLSEIAEWDIPGFGCSDCSCETHLFGMASDPVHSRTFQELLQYFRMDR